MKRFSFPLERIRRLHHEQAEAEEIHLRNLEAEAERIRDALLALERQGANAECDVSSRRTLLPVELMALEGLRRFVREQTRKQEDHLAEQATRVAQQRAKLAEVRTRARLFDRLKERAHAAWRCAYKKEQEEIASDLYLARWQRGALTTD